MREGCVFGMPSVGGHFHTFQSVEAKRGSDVGQSGGAFSGVWSKDEPLKTGFQRDRQMREGVRFGMLG